jgi:hypothetical protein
MHRNRLLFIVICLFCALEIGAQSTLPAWNTERMQHTRNAMWVLGGWASANVLVGAIGLAGAKTPQNRAFHQMNLGWGLINLGLAASGIWTAAHTDPAQLDWLQSMDAQQKLQRIFLLNAGLDVGYVMTGAWLQERAGNVSKNSARLRGFGRSIALQGAFLFVFDLGAYFYHSRLDAGLKPLLPAHSSIGATENGLGLVFRF